MKLTPELIQQLFQEEPHMKAAFEEQVPAKMDPASFWRKYGEYLVLKVAPCGFADPPHAVPHWMDGAGPAGGVMQAQGSQHLQHVGM